METKSFKMNRLFVLAVALMTLSVNVWGAAIKKEISIATVASSKSWTHGTAYTDASYDGITITGEGSGDNCKYYSTNGGSWRFYSSGNGAITITVPSGNYIKSVEFWYQDGNAGFTEYTYSSGTKLQTKKFNHGSVTSKLSQIDITYDTDAEAPSITVTNSSSQAVSSIDWGTTSEDEGTYAIHIASTGIVEKYSSGYIMYASVTGTDAGSFYLNGTDEGLPINATSADVTVSYMVEDEKSYSATLNIWGYKNDTYATYEGDYVSIDIPLSLTYETACTSISPTLTYNTSSLTVGSYADPTLDKKGSTGTVTYSIKSGSGASVDAGTGRLTANTAGGSVVVQASIAKGGGKCAATATSSSISITAAPVYHTVTWKVNGTTYTTTSNVTHGATVDAPAYTSALPCGDKLVGWTTTEDYFHASSQPGDLFTTTSPAITADVTFYAVFADRQE